MRTSSPSESPLATNIDSPTPQSVEKKRFSVLAAMQHLLGVTKKPKLRKRPESSFGFAEVLTARSMLSATSASLAAEVSVLNQQKTAIDGNIATIDAQIKDANATLVQAQQTLKTNDDLVARLTKKMATDQTTDTAAQTHVTQALSTMKTADDALSYQTNLVTHVTQIMNKDLGILTTLNNKLNAFASPRQVGYADTRAAQQVALYNYNNDVLTLTNETKKLLPLQNASKAAHDALISIQKEESADAVIVQNDSANLGAAQKKDDDAQLIVLTTQKNLADLANKKTTLQASEKEINRQLVVDGDEEAILAAQEAESQRLATAIVDSANKALAEETGKIGYAKMSVSTKPYGTDTLFDVRYRNPGAGTVIQLHIGEAWYGGVVSDQPVADGISELHARPGDGADGAWTMQMLDAKTSKVLDQVSGSYNASSNAVTINTVQADFSQNEGNMMSENPIVPDLKVAETKNNTILFMAATPHDQLWVYADTGGFLAGTNVSCPGGITNGFAMITIDAGCATGDYHAYLLDRPSGMTLQTISFHWNKDSKTITLTNPSKDALAAGTRSMDATTNAIMNLPTVIANASIEYIRRNNLYQQTQTITNPSLQLYVSNPHMLDLLFQQFPQLSPAYVNGTTGKLHDDLFNQSQLLVQRMTNALNTYEQVMSSVFQTAVDMFVKIYQGQPEGPLKENLHKQIDAANLNQQVQLIYTIPGVPHATYDNIVGAALTTFQQEKNYMIRVNADVIQAKESGDTLRAAAERKAAAEQFGKGGGDVSLLSDTMDASAIRNAARINNSLKYSTDPRVLALSNNHKQELAIRIASISPTLSDAQKVQQIQSIAADIATKGQPADMSRLYATAGISDSPSPFIVKDEGTIMKGNKAEQLTLAPGEERHFQCKVVEDSMVNITLTHDIGIPFNDRSASVAIYSSDTNKLIWQKNNTGSSANTISGELPVGTYYIVVNTAKNTLLNSAFGQPVPTTLNLNIDVQKMSRGKIVGMVSMEGSPKAFPVSMSVAEFKADGSRRDDFNNLSMSNNTTWVVIHGRSDNEGSGQMDELARSFYDFSTQYGGQVITVDWSAAAKDNFPSAVGLQDANWTSIVAHWVTSQLKNINVGANNVNLVGDSHGTYIAYDIAQELGGVNSIVALDPADNIIGANDVKSTDINFHTFAKTSWAIESSLLGSNARSVSADYSFYIDSGITRYVDPIQAHGFAISAFSALVEQAAQQHIYDPINIPFFSPLHLLTHTRPGIQNILNSQSQSDIKMDAYPADSIEPQTTSQGFEGYISVTTYDSVDSQSGKPWKKVRPLSVTYENSSSTDQSLLLHTLPVHESITTSTH